LTQLKCLLKSASGLAGLGSSSLLGPYSVPTRSLLGPDLVRVLVAGRHGAFAAIDNCALVLVPFGVGTLGARRMVVCQSWLREANFRGENCGCTPGVFVIVHLAHLHLARERITHRHAIVSRHGQDCIDEGIVAVYDDARRLTRARPSDLADNAWTSGVGINSESRFANK